LGLILKTSLSVKTLATANIKQFQTNKNLFLKIIFMKPNHILIALAILVLCIASFSGGIVGYNLGKKTCLEVTQSDTVRVVVHDSVTVKEVVKSQPRKVAKYKRNSVVKDYLITENIDTIHCDTLREIVTQLIPLADTAFYSDTLRNDTSYNIVVNDTIVGHRMGLGVEFRNLRPLVKETITNTVVRKPKPQIYAGAVVGINNTATNFMAGVSGAVAYKSFLGAYTYDFKNQLHQVGGYWRLWGK
jgi:hypothetical protein